MSHDENSGCRNGLSLRYLKYMDELASMADWEKTSRHRAARNSVIHEVCCNRIVFRRRKASLRKQVLEDTHEIFRLAAACRGGFAGAAYLLEGIANDH